LQGDGKSRRDGRPKATFAGLLPIKSVSKIDVWHPFLSKSSEPVVDLKRPQRQGEFLNAFPVIVNLQLL
jgi:hypothetical protein